MEPEYPGNDSDEVKNLVPNQVIDKNPIITNTGVNDMLAFMTVEVPVRNGIKEDKQPTELFWFKNKDDTQGTFGNHWSDKWELLE